MTPKEAPDICRGLGGRKMAMKKGTIRSNRLKSRECVSANPELRDRSQVVLVHA
jgi:hypothetical protein